LPRVQQILDELGGVEDEIFKKRHVDEVCACTCFCDRCPCSCVSANVTSKNVAKTNGVP
jgi:hypothetical protein